jgi:hypothetical protein
MERMKQRKIKHLLLIKDMQVLVRCPQEEFVGIETLASALSNIALLLG